MRRAALIGLLAALPSVASAQVLEPRAFSAERFALSLDRSGLLNVEWAQVPDDLAFDVSVWFGVADDPLTFQLTNETGTSRVGSLVHTRVGGGLTLALAFDARVQLGLDVPLVFYQSRPNALEGLAGPLDELSGGGLGAPRVAAKIHIADQRDLGLHVALLPALTIPVGQRAEYAGQDTLVFEPAVLLARVQGRLRFAANLGVRVRRTETYLDLEVEDELFAALGAGLRLRGIPVELDATLAAATALTAPFARANQTYVELMGGATVDIAGPLLAFAGAGAGLADGFGAPDWRVLGGLRLSSSAADPEPTVALPPPQDHDTDDDGLFDWDDRCPRIPGPRAAFGCPDADSDGDGVVDRLDACPNEREDEDAFEDGDGCPDPDDDGDGVPDAEDRCPHAPGTEAGCPAAEVASAAPSAAVEAPTRDAKVRVGATRLEITGRVYFDTGRSRIQPRSFELLDEVAAVIVAHPELRRIVIEGHTDSQGSDTANLALSEQRAASVRAYLESKGVDPSRLSSVGYGETRPVADNATAEGRAANRRVEFVIDPNP